MSLSLPAAALPSCPTPEQLPDDTATLKSMLLEVLATLQERDRTCEVLRQQLDLLLRRLYGPRSERYDPHQLLLFELVADASQATLSRAEEPADQARSPRRCRPHGRRRLPENLPHEPVHHTLPEAARLCPDCGEVRQDIGSDQSTQLEYQPASLRVIAHFVHKYVCRCQRVSAASTPKGPAMPKMDSSSEPPTPASASASAASQPVVQSASKPAWPIPKGLPGPGLLAHLIVSKYVDHLPLYRLERLYERQGVFLPRSTLCDWLAASAERLRPLYDLLVASVLRSGALHTDDTPLKLQDPKTHTLSTARLWVYLGDASHRYNVFDFTTSRQRDGPERFLKDFHGYLHADAFKGYDGLYLPERPTGAIIEVACNAHARRKFYEARTSASVAAHQALGYYRQLYALERPAADFSEAGRRQMRQEIAVPILKQFHGWLEVQRGQVLPKSPLGEAVGYALNNWSALVRYTEQGYLDIDNNVAEREMKRIAIGRKNWLFVGSEQGGRTAAILFSFTSTCQRLGLEPWAYLRAVLERLPSALPEDYAALLPDRWPEAERQRASSSALGTSQTAAEESRSG